MSFRKILLAVDQGAVAAPAADAGASVAKALGAEVGFVYVVDPGRTVLPGGGTERTRPALFERLGFRATMTEMTKKL